MRCFCCGSLSGWAKRDGCLGLAEGIVASPTITRRDESNVLTPFKVVESAKDAAKQGIPPESLNAASWGSTTPRSQRLKDRRRAVG